MFGNKRPIERHLAADLLCRAHSDYRPLIFLSSSAITNFHAELHAEFLCGTRPLTQLFSCFYHLERDAVIQVPVAIHFEHDGVISGQGRALLGRPNAFLV